MNFIQNGTIVYQAPTNEYVSYDFITDLVPTGIEDPLRLPLYGERNNTAYNLQGQRMKQLQKGLNIVNGKKIYVK
jgi:hypothetical protein